MMTGRKITVAGLALTALFMVALVRVAQAADLWEGSWKLNLAKSKFDPGPAPKSNILRIESVAGGGQKHTFDGVNAQGRTTHSERLTKFDGNENPVTAVAPPTKTVTINTFRRVYDHSFEVLAKVDGKLTTTNRIVVSRNGKTLTQTTTGKNAQGQTVNNTAVYEKH
jgi:opacity protein-like surface antigen